MLRTICPHILFWGADLKNTQKIIWELTIISLLSWWGLILVHFSSFDTHIFVIRKEEQNQDVIWEKKPLALRISIKYQYSSSFIMRAVQYLTSPGFCWSLFTFWVWSSEGHYKSNQNVQETLSVTVQHTQNQAPTPMMKTSLGFTVIFHHCFFISGSLLYFHPRKFT